MTDEPKRLNTSMHAETAAHLTPEEEELERILAEMRISTEVTRH